MLNGPRERRRGISAQYLEHGHFPANRTSFALERFRPSYALAHHKEWRAFLEAKLRKLGLADRRGHSFMRRMQWRYGLLVSFSS